MRSAFLRTTLLAAVAAGLLTPSGGRAQQTVRLPEKDRALALRVTPVFEVGAAEGNDWEMFTRVEQVAFDRADNLYVLDGGASRVLVFDRAGKFVRQFGRKGGGPGEFQVPIGLMVQADGMVAVADLASRSYSLFQADGKYLRSVPFAEGWMPGAFTGGGLAAHPRGGVVATMRPAPTMRPDGIARSGSIQSTPIVWQSFAEGARPVRLFDAPAEIDTRSQASEPRPGERRITMRMSIPVFTPRVNWGVLSSGGVVVSHTPGYTLKIMDGNGQVERYIQRPMRERKVTERDRERERERRREAMRTGEGIRVVTTGGGGAHGAAQLTKQVMEESIRDMEFAETIPAIQNLRVDGAGRFWVERTGAMWGEPGPIDVVTSEGRYLGTVTGQKLPLAFSASGRAAYVEKDDLGVERVVVKQLPQL